MPFIVFRHGATVLTAQWSRSPAVEIVPQSSSLSVGKAVFAVVDVVESQLGNHRLVLQLAALGILHDPIPRVEIPDDFHRPGDHSIGPFYVPDASRLGDAVFSAGR